MIDPERYPQTEETAMLDLMASELLREPDAILITDDYRFDVGTRFTVSVGTITGMQFPSGDVEIVENLTIFDNPDQGKERGIVISLTHEYGADKEPCFIGYVDHTVLAEDVQPIGSDNLEPDERDIIHTIFCLADIIPGKCEWTQDSYKQEADIITRYREQVEKLSQRGDRTVNRSVNLMPDDTELAEVLIENTSVKPADADDFEACTDIHIAEEQRTDVFTQHSDGSWSIERHDQEDQLPNPRDVLNAMWKYISVPTR